MAFIFVMLMLFVYNTCYSGTIKEKARVKANEVAVSAINNAVNATLKEQNLDYYNFFNITTKPDLTVSYLSVNTVAANRFKAELSQKILKCIGDYSREEITMSPFSMYGYTCVPFGLKIPVLVVPIEILSTDFISTFEAHGINQTLHKLGIKVEIAIKLLLPVGSESFDVKTIVPVTETIIVGNVPDTYTNVEGVTESGSDAILNLAP